MQNIASTITEGNVKLRDDSRRGRRAFAAQTRKQRKAAERIHHEGKMRLKPSAPELFAFLRPMLAKSRPIIGHTVETFHADGTRTGGQPIYGRPTFQNAIVNGEHV